MQKQPQKYCEMCGMPILGKGFTVVYEGSVITVCEACYSKIKKSAKIYEERPKKTQIIKQHSQNINNKKPEIEVEVVDDYYKVIKSARERLGLTTKQLAEKMRVSENIIKRFEQGKLKPTIEQAKELEKILSVKLLYTVPNEETQRVEKNFELTLGDIVNIREKK
ncbi:multiprotein bridging factor aMBF1 [Acidianus infernus]|uniref:multiprotein bridging factor aMBF1 n=1 Tax=Acidianus infernus TaxID=12915 RepID=UPI0035945941